MNVGLYLPDVPGDLAALDRWRDLLGPRLALASVYLAWGAKEPRFDRAGMDALRLRGLTPMVTWEPWRVPEGGESPTAQPSYALATIVEGRHDAYIHAWAEACRAYGAPLLLRPMHEMNGDWYPWCGTVNGNSPELYVRAWRHLRRIFAARGAGNVSWVWCPYIRSYPGVSGNDAAAYFPGDEWVDRVGLDGYNWGNRSAPHHWESFEALFGPAYRQLGLLSARPLLLAEVGCAEEGGAKDRWIGEMFAALPAQFPRVESLVWFECDKERDWRIGSSPLARSAFELGARGSPGAVD
jgi:beta-mannanase